MTNPTRLSPIRSDPSRAPALDPEVCRRAQQSRLEGDFHHGATRTAALLGQGALNKGSLADLALRLGVGECYLCKLFQRELGISPQALVLNQRLWTAGYLSSEGSRAGKSLGKTSRP